MEEDLYITKKQVVKTISDFLEPLMSENGFIWIKSKDEFVRKNKEWSFHISLNSKNFWTLKQEFNISIYVVNKEVNLIRKKFFENVKNNDQLFHRWLVLPNSNELEYKELYTSQDIEIAKHESWELIENEGLLFFEKNKTFESIAEYCKDEYFPEALISAKLHNESKYKIIKSYILNSDLFKKNSPDRLNSIENLISFLDKFKPRNL